MSPILQLAKIEAEIRSAKEPGDVEREIVWRLIATISFRLRNSPATDRRRVNWLLAEIDGILEDRRKRRARVAPN